MDAMTPSVSVISCAHDDAAVRVSDVRGCTQMIAGAQDRLTSSLTGRPKPAANDLGERDVPVPLDALHRMVTRGRRGVILAMYGRSIPGLTLEDPVSHRLDDVCSVP